MVDKRKGEFRTSRLRGLSALSGVLFVIFSTNPALSLSELAPSKPTSTEVEQGPPLPPLDEPQTGLDGGLPEPGPVIRSAPQTDEQVSEPAVVEDLAPVDILTDFTLLPEPAQRMRQLMLEAATTGDIENLRPLLGTGPTATQLSFGEIEADPIAYLRSISGDGEGQEILAILIDLLNTGFVRIDADDPNETYIWPYFAAVSLDGLTPPQKVDLLRIVTAGDVEDMKAYGGYNFYRVGISPDGEWRFFVAGD